MTIIDDLTKAISKVGKSAKKTFDSTKVELRIKNYSKENKTHFMELGQLVYEAKKRDSLLDENSLNEIISSIDGVKSRIKYLEKHLSDIKNQQQAENKVIIEKDAKKYAKLDKKENDFIMTRTDQGIKLMRFCSSCSTGNEANAETCTNCGYELNN